MGNLSTAPAIRTSKFMAEMEHIRQFAVNANVDDEVVELISRPRKSSKRTIRSACVQIIESQKATVKEKLRAIAILERLTRNKDFRLAKKQKEKKLQKAANSVSVDDILHRVNWRGSSPSIRHEE